MVKHAATVLPNPHLQRHVSKWFFIVFVFIHIDFVDFFTYTTHKLIVSFP